MKLPSPVRMMITVVALCLPSMTHADTIILKDRVLHGQILAETVSAFRFKLNCNGPIVFIPKTTIQGVRHNNRCAA